MRLTPPLAILLLAALSSAPPAIGDTDGDTYTFQIENDRIANTDRHYTSGFRLSWVSEAVDSDPQWAREILETIYPLADLRRGRIGASFGQSLFTPEDTNARTVVQDDRPYAGWLYGGISLHAQTADVGNNIIRDRLDTVELDIGIIGPYAFGEEVQNGVHELINVAKSKGWDNQLDTEPGVMLIGERRWRTRPLRPFGLELDLIPSGGGSLGNVMTFASAGAMLRLGENIDFDFGPPLIQPSLSGLAAVDNDGGFGWYVFAGGQGRAVARNIFLDGNTFSDSHSVDKKTFVGDFQFGVAVVYEGVRLSLTQVFRTREFERQRQADRFGALTLSARF
ncbi:MAG: lipid A deacylase LpxR family protein [Alphaproteobacteria bacterium]|nr:lipid A deacylase LpxR family protein [Alphaproteobacteria bacterium]